MLFKIPLLLPLLLLTSCRASIESVTSSDRTDSNIYSDGVLYKEAISQYKTADREKKENEKPERTIQPYIGLKYPPLPDALTSRGGWLIGEESENYSVEQINRGSEQMLWLTITTSFNQQGEPTYRVVDILSLPSFDDDSEIVTGGRSHECSVNGKSDPNLIVLAKLEDADTQYLTKIRKAWQVDQRVGKFKGLSLEGIQIKCQNVNYGI